MEKWGRRGAGASTMLHHLDIENYAVVQQLRVSFRRGLNLLTGETGGGKSILVDALALLLGGRAGADAVRGDAAKARVCGVFEPPPSAALIARLDAAGFELEDGELILERQIAANGKTRCFVNGRPATVNFLRELAPFLGDIHGQHDQQKLFSPAEQLEILDQFAAAAKPLETVGELYRQWRVARRQLDALRGDEQERLRLLDLYRFQHKEIDAANLEPGEDDQLRSERRKLLNVARLEQDAELAYDALYESPDSAAARLKTAIEALEELREFDDRFGPVIEGLVSAQAAAQDAAFELQGFRDGLEADPSRLDEVEERLTEIEKLKRKYGASLADVIQFGEEVSAKLAALEAGDQNAEALEQRLNDLAGRYADAAAKLSKLRRKAAAKLEKQVTEELASLAMDKAQFRIVLERVETESGWSASGADRLRFEFSANPGQPLKPLAQVASGGELSRVTLALKTCLKPADERGAAQRTVVFDEIDAGVGGRVADAIGRRLKRLAAANQVLCVTHLPQIAGFADAHYFVEKTDRAGQTYATLTELDADQRVSELARMLSGSHVTDAALENAKQLLAATATAKTK